MNFRIIPFLVMIVGMTIGFTVQGQTNPVKVIRVVGELLPPVTYANGTGQQFEVVKAIFEPLGYKLDISVYPYKRALRLVENGQADLMIGMLKDPRLNVLYSHAPHDADNLLAIFLNENKAKWHGIQSLDKQSLTVLAGLSVPFQSYLPDLKYDFSEVHTREQAISKLIYNRSNYIVDTEGSYILMSTLKHSDQLAYKQIGYAEIHAAFAKSELGESIKQVWDQHYPEFIDSLEAKAIYKKWGLEREYNVTKAYYESLEKSMLSENNRF